MKVGALNKRITFEAQSKTPDGMGGFTVSWTEVASDIPAAKWPVSATEQLRGESTVMVGTGRFVIRYRKVMNPAWRISHAGKYFNIVGIVDHEDRHKWLHILYKAA